MNQSNQHIWGYVHSCTPWGIDTESMRAGQPNVWSTQKKTHWTWTWWTLCHNYTWSTFPNIVWIPNSIYNVNTLSYNPKWHLQCKYTILQSQTVFTLSYNSIQYLKCKYIIVQSQTLPTKSIGYLRLSQMVSITYILVTL